MSRPPKPTAASRERRIDATPRSVTSTATPATTSLPKRLPNSATRGVEARPVDVGEHDAGAFAHQPRRDRRADAAGAAGDQRDAAGERLRLRHALQLGLLEQPVFDVERLLLRQADVVADARRAAHHVDRVDVELAGDARRRLVLGEGDHADAAGSDRPPRWGRASPGSPDACSARNRPRSRRGRRRAPRRAAAASRVVRIEAAPAAGSWCAGNGRGRRCRARRAASGRASSTNSSTSGASVKWPILRSSAEMRPRIAGISRAAISRRSRRQRFDRRAAEGRRRRVRREPGDRLVDDRDRRLVAVLGGPAPGEQAVAAEHDALKLRIVARHSAELQPEVEARPLPRQKAELAAEDLAWSAPRRSRRPRWR